MEDVPTITNEEGEEGEECGEEEEEDKICLKVTRSLSEQAEWIERRRKGGGGEEEVGDDEEEEDEGCRPDSASSSFMW
jgi:hypothetical protein